MSVTEVTFRFHVCVCADILTWNFPLFTFQISLPETVNYCFNRVKNILPVTSNIASVLTPCSFISEHPVLYFLVHLLYFLVYLPKFPSSVSPIEVW